MNLTRTIDSGRLVRLRAFTMKRITYVELLRVIDALPSSQLPGLLLAVVKRCFLRKVFPNKTALMRFVEKAPHV